ncbi:hypothetical protein BRDID11002_01740 [Bradyrhizobium diazoefficiens]
MAAENDKSRLDDAARAGWLYFIAGHTQDEIAKNAPGLDAPRRSGWSRSALPSG